MIQNSLPMEVVYYSNIQKWWRLRKKWPSVEKTWSEGVHYLYEQAMKIRFVVAFKLENEKKCVLENVCFETKKMEMSLMMGR